jgi:adenine phosphoribosyltransferase
MMDIAAHIRDIIDFPVKGIVFKDITTLLQEPAAFKESVDRLVALFKDSSFDAIVAMEARGFIFAAPMAIQLGIPFIPIRKPGKLPAETVSVSYELEYGSDSLEMHKDALKPGSRVLIVDDLLATGGTARGVTDLIEKVGCNVGALAFVIELAFLKGRNSFEGIPVHSLIVYDE